MDKDDLQGLFQDLALGEFRETMTNNTLIKMLIHAGIYVATSKTQGGEGYFRGVAKPP